MSTPEEKKASRARFEAVFPKIADEVLAYMKGEGMPEDAVEWMSKVRS
jgi:farnesyl diphosphate synthase